MVKLPYYHQGVHNRIVTRINLLWMMYCLIKYPPSKLFKSKGIISSSLPPIQNHRPLRHTHYYSNDLPSSTSPTHPALLTKPEHTQVAPTTSTRTCHLEAVVWLYHLGISPAEFDATPETPQPMVTHIWPGLFGDGRYSPSPIICSTTWRGNGGPLHWLDGTQHTLDIPGTQAQLPCPPAWSLQHQYSSHIKSTYWCYQLPQLHMLNHCPTLTPPGYFTANTACWWAQPLWNEIWPHAHTNTLQNMLLTMTRITNHDLHTLSKWCSCSPQWHWDVCMDNMGQCSCMEWRRICPWTSHWHVLRIGWGIWHLYSPQLFLPAVPIAIPC